MAREWAVPDTLVRLIARMADFGENIAEFPVSMVQERQDNGHILWVVDIHVRVKGRTEFDITAQGITLNDALRSAYLGLNNPNGIIRRAQDANTTFGVSA